MTNAFGANLEILADPEALAQRVAHWIVDLATAKRRRLRPSPCRAARPPQRLYERLAKSPYRESFPWSRTHWFWGDERFVPHADALSNYRMVREALLSRAHDPHLPISIPFRRKAVALKPPAAAYERELKAFYGGERLDPARPLFDVNILGLGPDGHTASLFPGTAVLAERERWAAAVIGAQPEARITLTYPALESCRNAAFLVEGKDKRDTCRQAPPRRSRFAGRAPAPDR